MCVINDECLRIKYWNYKLIFSHIVFCNMNKYNLHTLNLVKIFLLNFTVVFFLQNVLSFHYLGILEILSRHLSSKSLEFKLIFTYKEWNFILQLKIYYHIYKNFWPHINNTFKVAYSISKTVFTSNLLLKLK